VGSLARGVAVRVISVGLTTITLESATFSLPAVMEGVVGAHEFVLVVGTKPVPVIVMGVDAPAGKTVGCIEVIVGVSARAQGVIETAPRLLTSQTDPPHSPGPVPGNIRPGVRLGRGVGRYRYGERDLGCANVRKVSYCHIGILRIINALIIRSGINYIKNSRRAFSGGIKPSRWDRDVSVVTLSWSVIAGRYGCVYSAS
jgi:hypothetical protein